jgi:MoaA/NifB/PqqE/SkfB family radical SAM enzyme
MVQNAGIKLKINTIVTKQNILDIPELGSLLNEKGIKKWMLRRFYPVRGIAKANKDDLKISNSEYEHIINEMRIMYPNIEITERDASSYDNKNVYLMVSANGDLYRSDGCRDVQLGNLLKDELDIKEIVQREN